MSRTDRVPRRRLPVSERRAAIRSAAARAFARAPYGQVSVAGIAREAGASEALVHRYFGSKAELYVAVVEEAVEDLAARQRVVLDELPPGVPVRDRVRASLLAYLDDVSAASQGWAAAFLTPADDPPQARELRRRLRAGYVEALRQLLLPQQGARGEYALWGYFGFLDGAALAWVGRGCPTDEREPLVAAALGALEGALGDWGR